MKFILFFILPLIYALDDFFIGVSTSSFQIEGQLPGITIWDKFLSERPYLTPVGNATNHFLLFKEDVKMMYDLGIKHYRFSISWTRIMPYEWNVIDKDGIQFYHNLLDELHKYNITPYVTLYHWDEPAYLYPSWTRPEMVEYFLNYSKLMFKEYDSKVKHWMTINEPLTTANQGYGNGGFAPGIKNQQILAGHHQLLAHAHVGYYYKTHYNGSIGIPINSNWYEPIDQYSWQQANNQLQWNLGWFAQPLFTGQYPDIMKESTTPFTPEEQHMLMNSYDFFALNHYTTYYVNQYGQGSTDPSWTPAQSSWLFDAPIGMNRVLHYISENYNNTLPIYITECGFSMRNDRQDDVDRIHYLSGYLNETIKCIDDGINVKGFFVWSFLDNFEWASGYNEKFGIVYVDRNTFKRTPKNSAYMIKNRILTSHQ